jgi:hypothetical protein
VTRPDWRNGVKPAILETFADGLQNDRDAMLKRFVALNAMHGTQGREAVRTFKKRLLERGPPSDAALAASLVWLREVDLREQTARLATRAVVMHGARDMLAPVGAGRWLAQHLAGSRLVELPNAAHMPFFSHRDDSSPRWRPSLAEPAFPEKRSVRRSFERAAATYDATTCCSARWRSACSRTSTDPHRAARRRGRRLRHRGLLGALAARYPGARVRRHRHRARDARAGGAAARPRGGACSARAGRRSSAPTPSACRSRPPARSSRSPTSRCSGALRSRLRRGRARARAGRPLPLLDLRPRHAEGASRRVRGGRRAQPREPFVDMHDLGDALVAAGFADPVMEMEMITLEYASVEAVARDLKAIGARNAMPGRPRGLSGRGRWKQVAANYERHRREGALPASWEVIYGHAWKVAPKKLADGRQVIDFRPRGAT